MELPGMADAMHDPEALARADEEAERLLAELKEKVRVAARDVGTLRKELQITVPADVIRSHLEHNYAELRSDALVPGFRKGHAPLQLIQKRFGPQVRESLKTTIVGQSFFAAAENEKIDPLGDPLFRVETEKGVRMTELGEAVQHLKLPDNADFSYTCEVEIKPTFELPELKGIEVRAPKLAVSDQDVEEQIQRHCKNRGRYEPLADAARDPEDLVIADVALHVEGGLVKQEENVQLGLRPARLDGIPLMELGQALTGVRPGDERSLACTIPQDYERADLRGKGGVFRFKVHELKRLVPLPRETLVQQLGCESEQQLREFVRHDLEAELHRLVTRARKEQILEYLLERTSLDVPEQLSARQTDRAVLRKMIELQQNGVPTSEIEARIDELRTTAREDVARGLKLEFVLEKVAQELDVAVTDEEVNTEIARIARLYNRRFDRMRDDLHSRGLLPQLAEQIRQDKCIQLLLRDAKIVEVAEPEPPAKPPGRKKKAPSSAEAAGKGAEAGAAVASTAAKPRKTAATEGGEGKKAAGGGKPRRSAKKKSDE